VNQQTIYSFKMSNMPFVLLSDEYLACAAAS
jgi:hypothetical protein